MQPVSGNNLNDLYQQLINNILLTEQEPKLRMEQKKSDLKIYKGVLTDLGTKLSDLNSALETFTSATSNPFEALTATTAETSAFSVSAGNDATFGTHSLQVDRLAQTDTRVSQQYDADVNSGAGSLRQHFDDNGAQTFDIEVASPTDADPNNRESISVTVNPTGDTNAEILEEIAAAVNSAMANAVDDETISSDQMAQASVVTESSGTVRLSLRSGQTGYTNRLEFSDSASGLLAALDVTANGTTIDDASGGQIYEVGSDATDSMLNSKFVLDGLTLYRDSNSVDDALEDVTLNLQEADGNQHSFSVDTDSESIKEDVEKFVKAFNDVQKYIRDKMKVDPENDERGTFAGESALRALRYNLRNDAISTVSGLPDGAPDSLVEVGIELNDKGQLEITDADKLAQAAQENSSALKDLFGGEDGILTRMAEKIEGYVGAGSIVSKRQETVDSRIRRLENDILDFEDKIERRREQLTKQFAEVQRVQQQYQSQQQSLLNFFY